MVGTCIYMYMDIIRGVYIMQGNLLARFYSACTYCMYTYNVHVHVQYMYMCMYTCIHVRVLALSVAVGLRMEV